jgi:hypothetical protein
MHAYVKTAVLMFGLGLVSVTPAAGKGGSASSATSSSVASSGATSAGRVASGGSSASAGGGSANRAGSGMYRIYRPAPELDAKRRISEQDCTKPIVADAGNLRCK